MKKIGNGNFHHTLVSALSCVLLVAVAGVLVSICSLDSLVWVVLGSICPHPHGEGDILVWCGSLYFSIGVACCLLCICWPKNLISAYRTWGYKTFFMLNSAEHDILNARKYRNIKKFSIFQAQISLECIFLLINVKMPIIVGILTFMSRRKFMLSWVEHEKSFITSGPDLYEHISLGKCKKVIFAPFSQLQKQICWQGYIDDNSENTVLIFC